jgi:non-specific serine/threonine protein kinase
MFELKTVHASQPLRQRSLTDAFDWSLELLDEDSQRMFHLIAQFPAGVNASMLARVATSTGLELSSAIAIVGDLVDRSLVVRTNPSARLFIPEAGRYYSARRTLAEGTRTSLERIFIDVMAQYARKTERMFWFAPAPFWRSDAMPEAENLRAAFSLAISREYTAPLAILAMAVRHVWSEDGRSPTPISLGEPRVAELIARAPGRLGDFPYL